MIKQLCLTTFGLRNFEPLCYNVASSPRGLWAFVYTSLSERPATAFQSARDTSPNHRRCFYSMATTQCSRATNSVRGGLSHTAPAYSLMTQRDVCCCSSEVVCFLFVCFVVICKTLELKKGVLWLSHDCAVQIRVEQARKNFGRCHIFDYGNVVTSLMPVSHPNSD